MAARETGVVRFRFNGDQTAGQRYIGPARTQLGILKELMGFGGLPQLSRTVRLGDGTVIHCQSVFGQDIVTITPAIAAIEAPEEAAAEAAAVNRVIVVGAGYNATLGKYRIYRWEASVNGKGLLSEVDIGVEYRDQIGTSFHVYEDIAMSDDGSVIAGTMYESATGLRKFFRWTAAGGAVYLGVNNSPYLDASQIKMSSDGRIIVSVRYDSNGFSYKVFRWTSAGIVYIEFPVSATPQQFVCMSSNGNFIATSATSETQTRIYWWNGSGVMQDIGVNIKFNTQFCPPFMSADGSTIVVQGWSPDFVHYSTYRWTAATGPVDMGVANDTNFNCAAAISSNGAVIVFTGYDSALAQRRIYRWTAGTGCIDIGVNNNGLNGTLNAAPIGSYVLRDNFCTRITPDGSVIATIGYDSALAQWRVYRWTAAGGLEDIGINADGGARYPLLLSADGSVICMTGIDPATGLQTSYRWTSASGAMSLGSVTAGSSDCEALSSDGIVIAGRSGVNSSIWTPLERYFLGRSTAPPWIKRITKVLGG